MEFNVWVEVLDGQPASLSDNTEERYELAFASVIHGLHSIQSADGPEASAPRNPRKSKRQAPSRATM
jgi:hypothetical protein